ncbi:MAG: hypothetical protein GXP54_10815 [Deltaproteobacteria bacterium]|nr:hypothetical protein [Deltaproteobacteria bacterium]
MKSFFYGVLFFAFVGCSSGTAGLDDVLRVNHIQIKGTHNSFHTAPDPFVLIDWDYSFAPLDVQLQDQGVRQVELDVHYTPDHGFDVFHLPQIDQGTTCETFVECLSIVKKWSDGHPGHHLLFILVEPKDEIDQEKIAGHYDELDQEILSVWPRQRVLEPDDVRGAHATLREALETDGWPSLGETRNKAMFIMLDSGQHRDAYLALHPNLEGAVFFARGGMGETWSSVMETGNLETIREAAMAGYLVRTTVGGPDDDPAGLGARANELLAAGAHIISTDYPAKEEDRDWWLDLPGGTPSRCNPVTAPAECTSEAVEDL